MMNKFLQIKQQASGWPKHCLTDEEKNRYIDAFLDREDIKLEFSKIIENPCLRSLAKLMLNSFWGKFAQKENQNKTSIVRDCGEFFDMLTNPSIHVNTVLPVNEETLLITWEFREEAYDVSSTVNVVLASYVTALARLKLYSFLEKVEERAVYVDTDSCIYISRKGLDDISTGDFIGDMTDELNGGFISEFVSGGPKNYAYKYTTLSGEEQIVCKVTILFQCLHHMHGARHPQQISSHDTPRNTSSVFQVSPKKPIQCLVDCHVTPDSGPSLIRPVDSEITLRGKLVKLLRIHPSIPRHETMATFFERNQDEGPSFQDVLLQ
ncbi:unnamed protein product [Acanthoscelides obtectus]|uniref:DNA-directed DNA polymerase n=1 Tax=Acanthoscelides obtectus TaxID=200917 RepID=A0A9P0L858_ACAOB|nr:unnamed protein product [Acanthoscelides obtectus]CAK1652247.1 hypothetical protein AOBTE_LOCUS17751 [Acanthoscelides obtectus]